MTRRLSLVVGGVVTVVLVGVVVVVLTSGGASTTRSDATVVAPPSSATVSAATTTPARSTVVLAMGHLDDPANTFYELFGRSAGQSTWTLVTPPGVADNGGLVVGLSTAGSLTAGFLPSGALTFSVLATSPDGGTTWAPGEVPGTLAPWPDALAPGPDGGVYAVLERPSPMVVGADAGLATWSPQVTASQLTASTSRCAVTAVTAVTVTAGGTPVVGTRCTDSSGSTGSTGSSGTGLFVRTPTAGGTSSTGSHGWTYVGTAVGGDGPGTTTVLRAQAVPGGVAAVVERRAGPTVSVTGVWAGGGPAATAAASTSAPFTVPDGWSVRATAVGGGSGGSVAVLLASDPGSGLRIGSLAGPGSGWVTTGAVPAGTTAIATIGGEVDAFVPSGSDLAVWASTAGSRWKRTGTISVPIQYGSSG